MGSVVSSGPARDRTSEGVASRIAGMENPCGSRDDDSGDVEEEFHDVISDSETRARIREDEMTEFKKQLTLKREQRREILSRHRQEKNELEESLQAEKRTKQELNELNKELVDLLKQNNIEIPEELQICKFKSEVLDEINKINSEFEDLKASNNRLRKDLAEANLSLQNANSEFADLSLQNGECMKQITALKEVVTVSKTMLKLRENQLDELKQKLSEIEQSLVDREASMLSTDLRQEYERQLTNIRTLRGLYEERARLAEVTRQNLARELEEQKRLKQTEEDRCKSMNERVIELEAKVDTLEESIETKNSQISTCQLESQGLRAEMSVINKLFSQVLLGYKDKKDLDKLVHRLEENHGLLTHMAENEIDSEVSIALPKLLLELVSQVDEKEDNEIEECKTDVGNIDNIEEHKIEIEKDSKTNNTTAKEIVENLPKVWRVLMELLSHQTVVESNPAEKVSTCFKSVETKSGAVLVPSVSQTYIRLKDLIVEKLGLVKEVSQMKQLNTHLETRLEEQERRLCLVTNELTKTWHVVGRLRRHHHQLHTHEKILKYELQQKRKLLNELKEELAYCREKWVQAREKNIQSEKDWRKLRAEFTSRKTKMNSSFNNSAESGYSDERPSDESSESNDESEYANPPIGRSKKKIKNSVETMLDSSTDFNLAAEREDPVSDMLDVAELPLDTHDGGDSPDPSSSCRSEILQMNEKVCDETEDETMDIAIDSVITEPITAVDRGPPISEPNEHNSVSEGDQATSRSIQYSIDLEKNTANPRYPGETLTENNSDEINSAPLPKNETTYTINPAEILASVREQNERLLRKDQKFQYLEQSSAALLSKTQNTLALGEQLNDTLDLILNRPSGSAQGISEYDPETVCDTIGIQTPLTCEQSIECLDPVNEESEQFEKAGASFENMPEDMSNDLYITNEKDKRATEINCNTGSSSITIEEQGEASTSCDVDHETRFAARDQRLKSLEEQTKSLVKKVNKTNTKRVKLNYKLEELHNIYGSENSRGGTPSENSRAGTPSDIEDRSQSTDDQSQGS